MNTGKFLQTLHRTRKRFTAKFSGKTNTKRILRWPVYPLLRLDEKVLSRLAECDDNIRSPFQPWLGPPNPKSTTENGMFAMLSIKPI